MNKQRTQAQQTMDFWTKMMSDQIERWDSACAELEKIEKNNLDQTFGSIDDSTLFTKASLQYANHLGATWRRMVVDAGRRGIEVLNASQPKA